MTLHAIEITLTRAVGTVELKAAQQGSRLPLAACKDHTRLVVLVSAKNEHKAMRKIWQRLDDTLPIDVLCSLFPSSDGQYRMSIPMTEQAWQQIRAQAATAGQSPEDHLREAVAQALARDRSTRRSRLDCQLSTLLSTFTPEEITAAAARRIRPPGCPPDGPYGSREE
ncbi:hypothetical protein AB5J49_37970 [Streptomyces sp. R28]|uniref:Uncharacterized protein n=1 Tax=Streptomyces sp. R28 TaxID=3238628 RepID=A0AB39Q5Y7_9ACTN